MKGSPTTPVPAGRPGAEPAVGGVAVAVELEAAAGVDAGRHVADPPVDQVEVVARLVHQQAAGVLLLAVPAAEVVGAVHGVERPLEVHRGDLADLAGRDDLAQGGVPRGVPVVERHDDVPAGLGDRARDPSAARPVDGQRLLDDDVGPRGERPRHQLGVRVVGRGHDDDVDGLLGDHLLEAVGRVLRQPGGPAEGRRRRRPRSASMRPGLVSSSATRVATSACSPTIASTYMPARWPVPATAYRRCCPGGAGANSGMTPGPATVLLLDAGRGAVGFWSLTGVLGVCRRLVATDLRKALSVGR